MKVAINNNYGGWRLPCHIIWEVAQRKGLEVFVYINENGFWSKWREYNGERISGGQYFAVTTKDYGDIITTQRGGSYLEGTISWFEQHDEDLIAVIEKHGGKVGDIKLIEIPIGSHYYIFEHDGWETLVYSKSPIIEYGEE